MKTEPSNEAVHTHFQRNVYIVSSLSMGRPTPNQEDDGSFA